MIHTQKPMLSQSILEAPTDRLSAETEIREIEQAWCEAYEHRDIAALDRILADDYVLTDPLGEVSDKARNLAAIETTDVLVESTESDNVKIYILAEIAVVTARTTVRARYKGWQIS